MKAKILSILAVLLFCVTASVNAKILDKKAFEANKSWSLGVSGIYMHFPNDITRGGVGLNATFFGAYLSVMGWPSSHRDDVDVDTWDEDTSHSFYAGYQIPIVKAFRIIPIIGYAAATTTHTDGSDWSVDDSGIVNSQKKSEDASDFDFGGILCLNTKRVNWYFQLTKHTMGGGIAYQF